MATVLFFPEGAFGPTNNCVGIAATLQARGHRPVFVVEESFAGTLAARGFEERTVRLAPAPEQPEAPGQFWTDFVRDTSPVFRRPTIEQLEGFVLPTLRALVDGALYVDEQLEAVLDDVDPDVTVVDNVVTFPAVLRRGRPWVRMMSCNPLELPDPALPPVFSGYPSARDERWPQFRAEARRVLGDLHAEYDDACRSRGTPPLPASDLGAEWMHSSPWLNLSLYPGELDYPRAQPLDATWRRLDTNVRSPEAPWQRPAGFDDDLPLVYLSLGSLGSADLPLMRRLVEALATTRCHAVVSKGPLHAELDLPPGMVGEEWLPQPAVLRAVDAVITHGGNNTVTESMLHGLPMVVLPLFWDQHDNAQRVDEQGFGVRLDTYAVDAAELAGALDRVLGDPAVRERCRQAARRLATVPGAPRAADLLARLATSVPAVRA
jgi:MGT family glycosyltransferase